MREIKIGCKGECGIKGLRELMGNGCWEEEYGIRKDGELRWFWKKISFLLAHICMGYVALPRKKKKVQF